MRDEHSNLFACLWTLVLVAVCLASGTGSAAEAVWRIGVADNGAAEFALAPGDYAGLKEDAYFVVGWSDPARDWPYVQPGILDTWAGERSHTYSVLFRLGTAPAAGDARLVLDLVDTHPSRAPYLKVKVNGVESEKGTARGSGTEDALQGKPGAGKEFLHEVIFPAALLKAGDNLIEIKNHAGSWMVYDSLWLEAPGAALEAIADPQPQVGAVQSPPVLVEREGKRVQLLRTPVQVIAGEAQVRFQAGDAPPQEFRLAAGAHVLEVPITPLTSPGTVVCKIDAGTGETQTREVAVRPVRPWVVYLLHHTHLDIGYTHVQTEVERVQWKNLEDALDLIDKTRDYPEGARFKWLPEGLWAIDSYLKQATPEARARFVAAVRAGEVALDAFYGNELTALCRPDELIKLMSKAQVMEKEFGVTIDSAMITDVPGYTWGLVPAMAQSGVKYFSIGPNASHRIGFTLEEWGDKPYYWVSPSGKERVLCWVAGKSYSWFHRGPLKEEDRILDYLNELEEKAYPYNEVHVRYNIGGDNGPPDPNISDYVRAWNEQYASPRLVLATPSEMFRAFEAANKERIPEVRGDFTPYWEDGAASSALETAVNREAAERLTQAQTIFSLLQPQAYPAGRFEEAWRNVLLYDEHTWGAHNSISEPEVDFVRQQWAIKRAFAVDADAQSRALLEDALAPVAQQSDVIGRFQIVNTSSWPRTDLVALPLEWKLAGDAVVDAGGTALPSQRLADGRLAFVARDVPALGSAVFNVGQAETGKSSGPAVRIEGTTISNGLITVTVDPQSGDISSLKRQGDETEVVNTREGLALNQYLYVKGRDPKVMERSGRATVQAREQGPVVATLVVESSAPGCKKLVREISLVAGLDRVDLRDTLDRENVYEAEGVHLAFPFEVPGGVVRMETPWAVVRPDVDQMAGSCKNYFTVQRWVDVSNEARGVTLAVVDAPMIEVGAIVNDARHLGFLKETPKGTTIYSYVMNNYWETNYKASQPGPTTFRFSLRVHDAYEQSAVHRFGLERSQPLLPVAGAAAPLPAVSWPNEQVVLTSIEPQPEGGTLLTCYNASDAPQTLPASGLLEGAWFVSNAAAEQVAPARFPLTLAPQELLLLVK